MAVDRVGGLARSGWVPATLVASAIVALQLLSGTPARDLLAFGTYALLCLVVPGTLLWRLLRPVQARLWVEDVVFGTILGFAVEIPFYVVARFLDLPLLVLAWPIAVYVVALGTARGRALWRRSDLGRLPTWWSWAVALVTTYLVLFVARANWWAAGVSGERLRVIGPDAAFQLALTGELRHHVPATIPWVAGEPLHYHWLTYVHTAAATWVTGVEPIVMLRRLSPLMMAILVVLAVAVIAHRVSRRPPLGPLAAGLLVVVHSPAFYAAETDHFQRQEFTSPAIFGSPTMTFGAMLFCGVLLLVIEVLRDEGSSRAWTWWVLALLTAATCGAKATFAPMLVAGALTVLVISGFIRSLTKARLALFGLMAAMWLAFQFGFYAGDETGVRLTARGTLEFAAPSFGAATPDPWTLAGVAVVAVILLLWSAHMAGMLGLLPGGGWRDPVTLFLWGFTVSGIGASVLLELSAASQQWFVNSTQAAVAVGAAVGLGRLSPPGAGVRTVRVSAAAVALGVVGMAVGWVSTPVTTPSTGSTLTRLWSYAAPFLVTLVVIVTVAWIISSLRSRVAPPFPGLLFVCAGLTGVGLFRTLQLGIALGQVPWPEAGVAEPASTTVGSGGVETARWIRDASHPDELLATNVHTLTPTDGLQLSFWLTGYSERRVLVEGWGYTPRHSRRVVEDDLGLDEVPFWKPQLLESNDRAFTQPTRRLLRRLRDDHGVSWLVLDKRFPSDPEAVSRLLQPAYSRGDYVVYDLAGTFS